MTNPWLFRFSLFVCFATLLVLMMGAVVTDQFVSAPATAASSVAFAMHRHAAETVALLVLLVAGWANLGGSKQPLAKKLSWLAVVAVVAESILGGAGVPLSASLAFVHAFFGQAVFGSMAAVTMLLWPEWDGPATPLADKGWPSLRGLGRSTVLLIMIQIMLGAAFRHGFAGVIWHILGAFLVALYGVGLMVLLTQTQGGQPLRPAVITLGVLLGIQVSIGMVLISISDASKAPAVVLYSTVAHVITGGLTFAVTIATSMTVWRNVRAVQSPDPE
ncbi:MAG: COX15/CtaA family protein [Bryobacteraceae bacterium]